MTSQGQSSNNNNNISLPTIPENWSIDIAKLHASYWANLSVGHNRQRLEWAARQKIAIGAARGLQYLHEECRVGCIIHCDMRPNNILITHDFEPLVGDFCLARWQPDGEMGVETRVIGTLG
ncbi:hypothetical protein IFM89_002777 [Coptis chinensis]|uniref:Protein kinase domain-containing protein n=1 Tax=Coptis chinensis TaxID=261450 RepID=A0A835LTA9_9MAGN|nr:hypothetical protein IFM89_002777 [Coptis chinensis]